MRICFIPIDNRPVCYNLPKDITACDSSIEFYIPPREILGGLNKNANIEKIYDWMHSIPHTDFTIISLDTIAYGGLIPSRRSNANIHEIISNLNKFKNLLKNKSDKIFAFSSIMRISNNNINTEEKEYWAQYGTKIFDYSCARSKYGENSPECLNSKKQIPSEILKDYLQTRKRNFEINKLYLDWKNEGLFDKLIFSKDDCSPFGINIDEAAVLKSLGADIITGADEIPLTLLARTIEKSPSLCPIFTEEDSKCLISNYEDIPVEQSALRQAELAGFSIKPFNNADIILLINNFKKHQGELVTNIMTEPFSGPFIPHSKPYIIADVRFANGADNNLINKLFKTPKDTNFIAYAAWNTTANTIGSLLSITKFIRYAKAPNPSAAKKLILTRFIDDWAYQANIRQNLKTTQDITTLMPPLIKQIENFLGYSAASYSFSYPWNRLFEIEVSINMDVNNEFNRSHSFSNSSIN